MVFSPSFFHQRLLQFQFSETSANLGKPIMLGEALTPKFGQTFGTFVRSEGPCVALYNRAVVCENYSVITVSLVSQSSAINLSVEMRIPNTKSAPGKYHNCSKCASQIPNTKGAPGKYHNCALNLYMCCSLTFFASFFRTGKVVYKYRWIL